MPGGSRAGGGVRSPKGTPEKPRGRFPPWGMAWPDLPRWRRRRSGLRGGTVLVNEHSKQIIFNWLIKKKKEKDDWRLPLFS